jgi:hypothetical protein
VGVERRVNVHYVLPSIRFRVFLLAGTRGVVGTSVAIGHQEFGDRLDAEVAQPPRLEFDRGAHAFRVRRGIIHSTVPATTRR